ncbi:MAG: signal peptide peptidase SppA [Planctomycetaceae bacterium]|nr:signal peptide peptidase SppA [Planctomycetaceae bacterium]
MPGSRRSALWASFLLLAPLFCHAAEDEAVPSKRQPTVVAVFELDSPITERPTADDPLFGTIGAESLRSFLKRIESAGKDDNVAAVVLLAGSTSLELSQTEELHQVLTAVREKKPVYAHADSVMTGAYATLSAASRLSMSPTGDCWVTGLYGEQVFLKGLLDMLRVEADFLTCGEFKSAAEMFTRSEPSPEAAEMTKWMYDSIFETTLQLISAGRDVDLEQARSWIDEGLYSSESAKEKGLIDEVETREELTTFIKREHGATIRFDKAYGRKSGPEIDLNNPFAALQLWAQILNGPKKTRSTRNSVAVVYLDGAISLGDPGTSPFAAAEGVYSEKVRATLNEIAAEPRIRAVVLRVNSPGGSATASEIILQSVMDLQQRKPVVVSMGEVAASGGYYVSCRANRIFADASTLTGSIGVVAGKLATQKMWERIGVNFHPIQRGERAGMLLSSRAFEPDERDELQSWMDEVYGVFKTHVTEGRGDRLKKPIDEIAGGRVYTGQQALDLGLVDAIGTLQDAIDYAAEEANLEDGFEIRTFPEATNFLESLFADLSDKSKDDEKRLSASLSSAVTDLLKHLDPRRAEMVQSALLQLEILERERVMLTSPVIRMFHQ